MNIEHNAVSLLLKVISEGWGFPGNFHKSPYSLSAFSHFSPLPNPAHSTPLAPYVSYLLRERQSLRTHVDAHILTTSVLSCVGTWQECRHHLFQDSGHLRSNALTPLDFSARHGIMRSLDILTEECQDGWTMCCKQMFLEFYPSLGGMERLQ